MYIKSSMETSTKKGDTEILFLLVNLEVANKLKLDFILYNSMGLKRF